MCLETKDKRVNEIIHWLENDLKLALSGFNVASADASFRRYFRVTTATDNYIVMDAPPDKEDTASFVCIARLFEQANIHTPHIYQQNKAQGFLLLEDLGNQSYLDALTPDTADNLYQAAFDTLLNLHQHIDLKNCRLPRYDSELLQTELEIFYQWFLQHWLNIDCPGSIRQTVNAVLIHSAQEQPQLCVHRDFHSRNLMVLDSHSPGVIDFQDAVIGPVTYDLVSLLRDCYIAWPQQQVEQWTNCYYQQLLDKNIVSCNPDKFQRWFDLMGLQRHLKAIGIFTRLKFRDNKPDYMADIPRTLNYIMQILDKYPELAEFSGFIKQTVLPGYQERL